MGFPEQWNIHEMIAPVACSRRHEV
jgi:hypothetical protein